MTFKLSLAQRRRRNDVPFFLSFAFHPRRGRFQISMPEFFFEARKWELSKRASEEEGATEKAISPQITEKIPLPLSLVLLREYPSSSSRCSPFPEEKALSGQNAERPRRRSFAPDPNSLQGTVFDQITGTSSNQYLASNSWVTLDKICSPHVILWQDFNQGE